MDKELLKEYISNKSKELAQDLMKKAYGDYDSSKIVENVTLEDYRSLVESAINYGLAWGLTGGLFSIASGISTK